jgi:cbb3-type cytochrome oxidase cytochrome c subunit
VKQRIAVLLVTAAAALALPLAVTVADEAAKTDADANAKVPEGQKIFIANGCTSCHSMKGQGIEKKKTTTASPATTTTKPPDLSAVGIEHDQAWISKFLQKTETLHGKKHMKTWKGTPEQLSKLTGWLAEQKNAEAAGVKTSSDKAVQEAQEAKQEAGEAKQEAKEATEDAKEAVDKANEAKEDAKDAKDQSQGSQGK